MVFIPRQIAKADVAPPPDPKLDGVVPYQPQKTNVQMMSETVSIDILPSPSATPEKMKLATVKASFTMRNQGETEEKMQVIFPLSNLDHPNALSFAYVIDESSFVAKVNGQPISITEITTPAEVSADLDKEGMMNGYAQVRWAAFEVTFPIQRDVLLQVQYDMLDQHQNWDPTRGFDGIDYILETGAGWYGNILSADIILRFPFLATDEVISQANPGYAFSGNEMHWQFKNFEPTREDNLEVRLFQVDVWQTILKLRAHVKQNPKDADAWVELGDRYMDHVFVKGCEFLSGELRFAELAVEARQKVTALHPDSGIDHYKLAESLWYNNLNIQKRNDLHLEDTAIQQVFRELEQAWVYGVKADTYDCFTKDIRRTFPEVRLEPPVIVTVVNAHSETPIPTSSWSVSIPGISQTSTPTDFPTSIPVASPTLIPTISPTPLPAQIPSTTSYTVMIVIVSVAAAFGIIAYRSKSKSVNKR